MVRLVLVTTQYLPRYILLVGRCIGIGYEVSCLNLRAQRKKLALWTNR